MQDQTENLENTFSFNPKVLGKISLLQTALHVIPNQESLVEFLCRGLENIPGTCLTAARINSFLKSTDEKRNKEVFDNEFCEQCNGTVTEKEHAGILTLGQHRGKYYCICVQTINENYGCILFEISNCKEFEPYQPFLENLANTVALTLEIRNQENALNQLNNELRRSKDELEVLVQERTKDLILKNEELDRFFNTSLDLLCIADFDGYFHRLNLEWGKMLGYSLEELEGKSFLDFVHPDDLASTITVISELASQKEIIDFTNRYRCKDGTYRWIEWRSTSAGKLINISARDITERKLADTALREANQFNEQIINSAEEGIIVYGTDLRYKVWNPYMEQLSGITAGEVIGKHPLELFPFLKEGGVIERLEKSLEGEISHSIDFPFKVPLNGRSGWSSDTSAPLRDTNGEIIGVIGTVRDITERILAEKELTKAKEKAEESDKLKTEFLAQVSHEIRSPLNIILGLLSLIKDENKELIGDKSYKDFEGINNAAKRIIRTIDLILNMSQMQIGSYEGKIVLFDLMDEVIENIYLEYYRLASEKGLQLNILKNNTDSKIMGDRHSVYQIFVNLIDNAIKYTNSGEINLDMYRDEEKNLVVRVSDTGIGISEEYFPMLFQPFSQEQQGYTRHYEGNGLGLALVKNYCNFNKAQIEVKSKKGEGSTFIIIFPNFKTMEVS